MNRNTARTVLSIFNSLVLYSLAFLTGALLAAGEHLSVFSWAIIIGGTAFFFVLSLLHSEPSE